MTIRAETPSPPPYSAHAREVLRAAAPVGRVSTTSSSVPTLEQPPRVHPHCLRARSTTPVPAPAETRAFLKKTRLQVAPAESRTHLPAYSRHEIEVLSSAQQDLLLPPSTYADLSPDARTRYRVLFQTAYLPPDYPIHPYFTRRVNSGPMFPFVAVLTAHHRQRLSQLSRTPAVTRHAQR